MNKSAIVATMFDAACFFLANFNIIEDGMVDVGNVDLKDFKNSMRCIIKSSAEARVAYAEVELGLVDKPHV